MTAIKGWDSLMAKLDALGGSHLQEVAKESVLMLALATTAAAKMLVSVDSGELRGSIHEKVEVDGSQAIGYSYTNSDHAAFVEFGTGPVGAESGGNGSDVQVSYSLGPFKVKRGTGRPGEVVESWGDYWVYCDESYPGDNRLIPPKSSHRRGSLAPRCRLITSWGCSRSQGFGCSPIKVVRELGSERRETVRSLSVVGAGNLRGSVPSTRGPGWTNQW
jgi:hypothetical protein